MEIPWKIDEKRCKSIVFGGFPLEKTGASQLPRPFSAGYVGRGAMAAQHQHLFATALHRQAGLLTDRGQQGIQRAGASHEASRELVRSHFTPGSDESHGIFMYFPSKSIKILQETGANGFWVLFQVLFGG